MPIVQEKFVAPGEGRSFRVLGGDLVTIKASAADTNGAFTLLETLAPAHAGPPLHVHSRESETFYVVEGTFEFQIGERRFRAGVGATVIAPVGIPHRFENLCDTPSRMLVVCQPGGFERFLEELAAIPFAEVPDMAAIATLGAKYGIRFPN